MPRLYLVEELSTGTQRLINANTASQALAFVTRAAYTAKPASADEVASAYEAGLRREDALSTANEKPNGEPTAATTTANEQE